MAKITTKDLKRRIHGKHPLAKSWIVFEEVCPMSGSWGKAGSIDSLAVCLSAPRDFAVHGFEVKISRSDWLTELNNPAKNQYAIAEVDYWWIVAPSVDIVHVDELPDKWGLYTCSGRGLRVTKRAKRLHPVDEAFSRSFIVSLLWKFSHWDSPADKELQEARREAREEGIAVGKARAESDRGWDSQRLEELRRAEQAFEKASGHHISEYNGGKLGILARCLVERPDLDRLLREIVCTKGVAENVRVQLGKAEDELKKRLEKLLEKK